jgi:hypothetical protein
MICDIIERINIKKVDECIGSDIHIDPIYARMHPNAERLLCHMLHVKGPKYHNAFYVADMICEMILHPSDIKRLSYEMRRTLTRRRRQGS